MPTEFTALRSTLRRPNALLRLLGGSAIATSLLVVADPLPAAAQDFSIHLEPAATVWLDRPQTDRFTPGLYAAVRPSLSLGRFVAAQLSYAFLYAPADDAFEDAGSAHMLTAGLRLRPLATLRPEAEHLGGLWMDFNAGYARTGPLDRFTFDTGIGYGFHVSPSFAFGPAIRYVQVVEPDDRVGFDPSDARFITFGLNFTFGPAKQFEEIPERIVYRAAPAQECVQEVCEQDVCVQRTCPVLAPPLCIDTDGDGICDDDDRCPLHPGSASNYGCPVNPCDGSPLRMLVQFDHDSAAMPVIRYGDSQTMDPVLDRVAEAIALDPSCRVGIIGHASEEGGEAHNQQLSESRAAAVQRYMVDRGIAADRIPAIGMGERCQLSPERSRVLNRRVEFFRLEEGAPMPTACLP